MGQNWGLIILGLIVILGVLVYTINSTLSEGSSVDLSQSVRKILLNYLQVISLSRTFPLRWPKELITLFQMQGSISTLGEHIVNVDCVVGTGSSAALFYGKLVFFALLPVGASVLAFCFWYFYGICKATHFFAKRASRREKTPKDKWIASVGVVVFLLYPTLCEETFSTFSCKWVGTKQYLQVDLEEPCFEGRHETMILALAVPLLLAYVIGLPALVLLFLIRNNAASGSRNHGTDDSDDQLSGTGVFGNPIVITRWGLFFKG